MIPKAYPEEKVGVFARRNGALEVVEYSGGSQHCVFGITAFAAALLLLHTACAVSRV